MKKFIIIFIISYIYSNDIKDILNMTKLLKNYTTNYQPIQKVYDPFSENKPKTKPIIIRPIYHPITRKKPIIKKTYHLEVVFLDKVRINGNWYKNNSKIDDYKVIIKENGNVYLINKQKTIHLTNKNSLLKVSE